MLGKNAAPLLISLIVHVVALGAMAFYKFANLQEPPVVAVETVIADERTQQEFEQDLSLDTTTSENLSVQSGGMVTTAIGAAAAQPISQTKIEQSEALKDPDIKVVTIGDISIPGAGELNVDLGEGEVSGEVGARVEGYGAAMSRMTQEIIRMMRRQPVLCVWLFDASNSLKDDREEIAKNFNKIYEELKIAERDAATKNQRFSPLETMVCQFGQDIRELLPKPTNDIPAIQKAIGQVKEDESGVENTFGAISKMIDKYASGANRNDRKLCLIVVSDETGEDDDALEELIVKSDKFKSPIYFMGREAIFGYPYARMRWIDPEPPHGEHHITVLRGPETARPECLQYDGLHERWDSASSGFGPYGQVRLAKKSGGIYFMLSGAESELVGWDSRGIRKFDDLAMKEYEPLLMARREYDQSRAKSEFRSTIWQVIEALNPHLDDNLRLKTWHYPMDQEAFQKEGKLYFERGVRALKMTNDATTLLAKIEPQRAHEREPRWRAAYDLARAQLLAYRVRQFQYLLALDKHAKEWPKPKDPKANYWNVHRTREMLPPDPEQVKASKVDVDELNTQMADAIKRYDFVIQEHPGTPWARRAQMEKDSGFGIAFVDHYWDPKYDDPEWQKRIPKF